jgi:hypothetical protein
VWSKCTNTASRFRCALENEGVIREAAGAFSDGFRASVTLAAALVRGLFIALKRVIETGTVPIPASWHDDKRDRARRA